MTRSFRLEERGKELKLQKKTLPPKGDRAQELVQRFLDGADTNRELLVALIGRVELTEDKDVIVQFRFRKPG